MSENCQTLDYVTASQGQIYIDGILLDEVYDIQYTYREFKEPVYGYNSKHFSSILRGTVIIHGQFSINYRHDSYLPAIFSKVAEEVKGKGWKKGSPSDLKALSEMNDKAAGAFKEKLRSIKDGEKNRQEYIKKIESLNWEVKTLTMMIEKAGAAFKHVSDVHGNNIDKLQSEYNTDMSNMRKNDPERFEKVIKSERDYNSEAEKLVENLVDGTAAVSLAQERVDNIVTKQSSLQEREREILLEVSNAGGEYTPVQKQSLADIFLQKEELEKALIVETESLDQAKMGFFSGAKQQETRLNYQVEDLDGVTDFLKKDNIKRLEEIKIAERDRASALQETNETFEALVVKRDEAQRSLELLIKEAENNNKGLNEAKDSIRSMKQDMMDVTEKMLDSLKKQNEGDGDSVKTRPEDAIAFNIFFNYNGLTHKILKNCHLTGHSHAVQQGGEAIREYYSFVAREIV